MTSEIDKIKKELMESFDRKVSTLSQEDYRDICEELTDDFQCRYDAVNEEIRNQEEGEE